jgi:hypothetical protein
MTRLTWLVLGTMLIELYTWHLNVTRGVKSVSGKWHVNMITHDFLAEMHGINDHTLITLYSAN